MQFQVPQFTDIEDKVIGPFTLKQFLYIAAAGGLLFILFKILKFFVFLIIAIPIGALTISLAFVRVHDQPFISVVKNFFGFLRKPDFYIWKKPEPKSETKEEKTPEIIKATAPKRKLKLKTKENLQEIGWKIEIQK